MKKKKKLKSLVSLEIGFLSGRSFNNRNGGKRNASEVEMLQSIELRSNRFNRPGYNSAWRMIHLARGIYH